MSRSTQQQLVSSLKEWIGSELPKKRLVKSIIYYKKNKPQWLKNGKLISLAELEKLKSERNNFNK